ncbi:hypothetical protein CJ030_MR2G016104 [Morella rubra]|uniref:Uncharacterized protein n=1 Tax=Morella rubra TaxID=262757 RepID=A0A6A1WDN6_9ROSI|nr:hypothetical protein CJ030_MR2G016104 [Morella rubra]
MSSDRSKCVTFQAESSRARKKARKTEEPSKASEIQFFWIGLHQNRFAKDFQHRKVFLRKCVLFSRFSKHGSDFKEMFDYQGWSNFVELNELGGEERDELKVSKEYNKKTIQLMGFIENAEGEWVKKGVVTQKGVLESREDDEVEEDESDGGVSSYASCFRALQPVRLTYLEATLRDLKEEQQC